ncbi:hypothetical protein NKG94_51275 [Micromonospora sp. M12]
MAASPEHIFAMKALAARTRDVDDLRALAALAKVTTVDDAVRLCSDFYPDEAISPRAMGVIRELSDDSDTHAARGQPDHLLWLRPLSGILT